MSVLTEQLSFGMELEVTAGADDLAQSLYNAGHIGSDYKHDYHCSCDSCHQSFNRSTAWTYQDDPTVDGEFITRPFWHGADNGIAAIVAMGDAMASSRARVDTGTGADAGNHVHVTSQYLVTDGDNLRNALLLERIVVRYEDTLNLVAQAAQSRVRGYNGRCYSAHSNVFTDEAMTYATEGRESSWNRGTFSTEITGVCGDYVRVRPRSTTTEFRLWNATRSAWRMKLHADLSVAMMAAACNGVSVTANDERPFIDVVGDFMPTDSVKSYYRQLRLAGGK